MNNAVPTAKFKKPDTKLLKNFLKEIFVMDPEIITKTDVIITGGETQRKPNPLFPFMGIGSLIYAFFYTLFLYRNNSGLTYPFFVGGTCFSSSI